MKWILPVGVSANDQASQKCKMLNWIQNCNFKYVCNIYEKERIDISAVKKPAWVFNLLGYCSNWPCEGHSRWTVKYSYVHSLQSNRIRKQCNKILHNYQAKAWSICNMHMHWCKIFVNSFHLISVSKHIQSTFVPFTTTFCLASNFAFCFVAKEYIFILFLSAFFAGPKIYF